MTGAPLFNRDRRSALLRAGLLTGVVDGLFSSLLNVFAYHSTAARLFQGVAVIPILVHRPPAITARWWIQFFGHIPFVGLPIAVSSRRRTS